VKPSRRVAESLINQILRVVKSLKLSQPKAQKQRGVALKRAKAHEAITEWVAEMLLPYTEAETEEPGTVGEALGEEDVDAKRKLSNEVEKVDTVKFDHFGKYELSAFLRTIPHDA
jgi:hypothetical protein